MDDSYLERLFSDSLRDMPEPAKDRLRDALIKRGNHRGAIPHHIQGSDVPESEIDARQLAGSSVTLSHDELLALVCCSHGLGRDETAEILGVSVQTIKTRLRSARYRMRAKTSAEAACEAIRRGLIP